MAIGFSGSNGGITNNFSNLNVQNLDKDIYIKKNIPLEVSYFVNNICNLKCKHCYVGYQNNKNLLNFSEWKNLFDSLIKSGAKTFGNVGKEPLLNWNLTIELLHYFKFKRNIDEKIRFGFVTNGLLFDKSIINELNSIEPDYIDISLDGDKTAHDYIRGEGNYEKLISKLIVLSKTKLASKIFISFTLNKLNKETLPFVIETISNLGINNFLISPYVTLNKNDELYLSDTDVVDLVQSLLDNKLIDFDKFRNLNLYIKNDFTTTSPIMSELKKRNIINEDKLLIDNYCVIFNKYHFNTNTVYLNYLPYDNTFTQAIRISHDGYISSCLDMFYEDYPERAIGNIKSQDIKEILSNAKQKIEKEELVYV
ncbi:MAG: radical SAM protein [Bacteroidales bacterium]|nr:radical SAM protein [Bacteroidales bacterium]